MEVEGAEAPGSSGRGRKRQRKTAEQVSVLEAHFAANPLPDKALRDRLGVQLGLTTRQVQIWFQNKRAKAKQDQQQPLQPPLQPTGPAALLPAKSVVQVVAGAAAGAGVSSPGKRKRSDLTAAAVAATTIASPSALKAGGAAVVSPSAGPNVPLPGAASPVSPRRLLVPHSGTTTTPATSNSPQAGEQHATCPLHSHLRQQHATHLQHHPHPHVQQLSLQPRVVLSPMEVSYPHQPQHCAQTAGQQPAHHQHMSGSAVPPSQHDTSLHQEQGADALFLSDTEQRLEGKSPSQLCLEFELQSLLLEYLEKDMVN